MMNPVNGSTNPMNGSMIMDPNLSIHSPRPDYSKFYNVTINTTSTSSTLNIIDQNTNSIV